MQIGRQQEDVTGKTLVAVLLPNVAFPICCSCYKGTLVDKAQRYNLC
jgi:hypothetical protein